MARRSALLETAGIAKTVKTSAEAIDAFEGKIKRVWTSPFYFAGMIVVATAMVLLPVIYIGLIGLAGYGVYYHAVENTHIMSYGTGRARIGAFLLYVAPIVIGVILVLFMVKPLFARAARRERRLSLVPENEPQLFAFVHRLCEVIGSPKPKRIDVDCEINASASFRRGFWSLFWPGDLVLTIGVPLVAGLSLRQFTEVLAHEFGHFAQGLGMRLTYIIRSVNIWFSRVVYERDSWDEWLTETSHHEEGKIAIVFMLARLFVWITRRILWLLMMIGHVISCAMLRQMEYDADRHAARVVGSEAAIAATQRVQLLMLALQKVHSELGHSWQDGKLADDFPRLLTMRADSCPRQLRDEVYGRLQEGKTGLFDTHPSDAARIRRAEKDWEEGVFRVDGSTSILFDNFPGLCQSITLWYYQDILGPNVTPKQLVSTADMTKIVEAARKDHEAAGRYFHGCLTPLRLLDLERATEVFKLPPKDCLARLKRSREALEKSLATIRNTYDTYGEVQETISRATMVSSLIDAGIKLNPKDFDLKSSKAADVPLELDRLKQSAAKLSDNLVKIDQVIRLRLLCAISLLSVEEISARVVNGDILRRRADKLIDALTQIRSVSAAHNALRNKQMLLHAWASIIADETEIEPEINSRIGRLLRELQDQMRHIRERLLNEPYPFKHTTGNISLADHVVGTIPASDDFGGTIHVAERIVDNLDSLYGRIMGELASMAERVEKAIGLKPLKSP